MSGQADGRTAADGGEWADERIGADGRTGAGRGADGRRMGGQVEWRMHRMANERTGRTGGRWISEG